MRDDNGCATFHQPFDRLADLDFGLRVHTGRCLVQDQDLRIVRERPREGQKLTLSNGKHRPPLVHRMIETQRQPAQERPQVYIFCRGRNPLARDR